MQKLLQHKNVSRIQLKIKKFKLKYKFYRTMNYRILIRRPDTACLALVSFFLITGKHFHNLNIVKFDLSCVLCSRLYKKVSLSRCAPMYGKCLLLR